MTVCCKCNKAPLSEAEDPTGKTELRPYGPDDAPICYSCATGDPDTEKAVDAVLNRHIDAAEQASLAAIGRKIVILTPTGIKPFSKGSA